MKKPLALASGMLFAAGAFFSVALAQASSSLFGDATPAVVSNADTGAVTLGVKFRSSTAGTVSGIRYYKAADNTGTHTVGLYDEAGALLADATVEADATAGWREVALPQAVAFTPGTTYTAAYHTPTGHYSSSPNFFANDHTNGPLSAPASASVNGNGVYNYGAALAQPTQTFNATNYWVDVVFEGGGPDTEAPSVPADVTATAVSPYQASLSWLPSTDNWLVTGYKVFRDDTEVATVSQPGYTDLTLSPESAYSYTVLAFDSTGNTSAQSTAASVTTPAHAPFAKPDPEPAYPAGFSAFGLPSVTPASNAPQIASVTSIAGPDDSVVITGTGFTATTKFRLFGQSESGNAFDQELTPTTIDAQAATVLVPAGAPASMYMLWPVNDSVYGKPATVNRTEAWWLGPQKATAGERISLYGRNLTHGAASTDAWLYLKPVGSGEGQWLTIAQANPYKVSFDVPALTPGNYEVWAHNGQGQSYGWSGPLVLNVLAASPWSGYEQATFNVRDYGATGDGTTDDWAAITAAVNAAKAAGGRATIYFPTGNYMVSKALEAASDLQWKGNGKDLTWIKQMPGVTTEDIILYKYGGAVDNIEFRDLSFDSNGHQSVNPTPWLIQFHDANYARFKNVRIKGGAIVMWSNDVVFEDSELIISTLDLKSSEDVIIRNNLFMGINHGEGMITSWGGKRYVIENNVARDYDKNSARGANAGRFFLSAGPDGSLRDFYFGNNETIELAPSVNAPDSNKGEQFLFEMTGNVFAGTPSQISPTTFVLSSYSVGSPLALDAIITRGRGVGQYRNIVGYDAATKRFIVSPAWNVEPDQTSTISIGAVQARTVIYNNTLQGKADYATRITASAAVQPWGNTFDLVFDDNSASQMGTGIAHWLPGDNFVFLGPTYHNVYQNNSFTNMRVGVGLYGRQLWDQVSQIGSIGTIIRSNTFTNIANLGVYMEANGKMGSNFHMTVLEHNAFSNNPTDFFAVGKGEDMSNTVLYDNTFTRGTAAYDSSIGFYAPATSTWYSLGNRVEGYSRNNSAPLTNASNAAPVEDTQTPTVPTEVVASTPHPDLVNVEWHASSDDFGVTGYRIFRDGTLIGTSTQPIYRDITVQPNTAYTYEVLAYDASGKESARTAAMQVTTPATISLAEDSLFATSSVPSGVATNDTGEVTLGVRFIPAVDGAITSVRYYKDSTNTGTHTVGLYNATGTLLASAMVTAGEEEGWTTVSFESPVPVLKGEVYTAAYHTPTGRYSLDKNYWLPSRNSIYLSAPGRLDGDTTGNGVFRYGAALSYPNESFNDTNYWVDVVFAPTSTTPTGDTEAPTVPANLGSRHKTGRNIR
jgi:polygalacturonase